jgi:hypothetical protein
VLKNLKLLLTLRAWLKSDTLKAGGAVGILAAIQTFIQGQDGASIIEWVAAAIGVTGATASGLMLGVVSLLMLVLRAKTERALGDK